MIQALSELLNTCSCFPLQLVTHSVQTAPPVLLLLYMAKCSLHISLFRFVIFVPVLMRKSDFNAAGLCGISYLEFQITFDDIFRVWFNPLNAELNPICYLLALLRAHHFLHVSRIRVKSLTLRLIMSYIYICMEHQFLMFLDHTQRRTTVGRTPLDE